jgi:hypothetical protein
LSQKRRSGCSSTNAEVDDEYKKDMAFRERIDSLKSDFNQDKINLDDFLEGLSLLVGTK